VTLEFFKVKSQTIFVKQTSLAKNSLNQHDFYIEKMNLLLKPGKVLINVFDADIFQTATTR
jgi:hypothetical protein